MTDRGLLLSVNWQQAKIVEIIPQTRRIKSFVFKLPQPFAYRAGQHVDIRLTAPDGYRAMRSYSIASAPDHSGLIELAIEFLEDGEVSSFLHGVAAVGDEIELRGPLGGHFTWAASDGGPILLIGGGSGAVPLISIIRDRHMTAPEIPAMLLYSVRSWDDVLHREELLNLSSQNSKLTLVLTLTRDKTRRPIDFDRRIDGPMISNALAQLAAAPKHVFVCGSNSFVNAATDSLISNGINPASIRVERYGV